MVEAWPNEVYHQRIVQASILGRPVTFVTDPGLVYSLLVDQAHKLVREEMMTRALRPALGTGLLTADARAWRHQRRTAAPAFRPDRVRGLTASMAVAADATRMRWQGAGRPQKLDLQTEMMRTAFDIIVGTVISGDEGFDTQAFSRALDAYLGQTHWVMALTMLGVPAWVPHPGSLAGSWAARTLRTMGRQVIRNRRASGADHPDLLGLMLSASDPDTGAGMTEDSLIDNLLTFVMAGHETTALVIAWTLRLLASHPDVERKMLDEIAAMPSLSSDPAALDMLVYTKQVVFEAMRLYPPAALLVRSAAEPVHLDGIVVPPGGSIHVPVYALHRHRRLWANPDSFDPSRFGADEVKRRHRCAFLPFGAGPRVCIGMSLALTECLVVLATLLPAFHFRPMTPQIPDTRLRVTLRPHGGLPVIVTPRNGG